MNLSSMAALPADSPTPPADPADRVRALPPALRADVAAVSRIGAVPTILKVVSEMTGLRLALVARVTADSWTACAVLDRMDFGLHVGGQLEVATTLCKEVHDTRRAIVIEHASRDAEYCTHHTPKLYQFESYVAVPITRPDGEYFGNLCALDAAPRPLRDEKMLAMLRLFAELIGLQLAAEEASDRDRAALTAERETAELREQFIAVLGHDLRNPLAAVLAGTSFLLGLGQEEPNLRVLERIRSSGERMSRLITDIMDFARARLGGGVTLTREPVAVGDVVRDVVAEITAAHPDRTVRVSAPHDAAPARVDRARVAQLLSNLVANAVQHGARDEPVDVRATRAGDRVRLAVASRGAPIPPDVLARLFQPYVRGDRPTHAAAGLGLGLYIASAIARAHGGTIGAESTPDGLTTFTVELPAA